MKSASPLSFRALTAAQSFASLNNNLLKVLISLMAATAVVEQRGSVMDLALTVICFNVPFLLFSGFAGACADRFSKSAIVRFVRVLDVALMLLAFFFLVRADLFALLLVLFLLGMQGAVFSPAKYGLLPELLDDSQISRANGYLELWNLVGIIAGTTLGAFLAEFTGKNAYLPGMCLAGFAIAGALCAFFIEKTPAANPVRTLRTNPFEAIRFLREIKLDNGLFQTVVGISLFWALGALYQLNLPLYAKQMAGLGDAQAGMLIAVLGLGIGLGSLLAGHVSEGKVELGLVPMGAAGISLTSIVLAFCYEYFTLTLIVTLGLGLSSGFFIVPLQAFLQQRSPAEKRGSYIAAANFAAFTVMIGASFLLGLLLDLLGITPANVFFVFGMATVAVAAYICTVLPQMLVRCMNWILIHTLYRVRVVGVENIPASGGALLVCNHMSFVDPLLLLASLGRHVRFLMYRPIYEARLINPAARTMGAIPIGRSAKREDVTAPLAEARQAIQDGELVGIFAEGGISRIGQMLKFRRGLERIMDGLDAPIIPIHLDQIWGSIFSFRGGRF
ncbi:MAG TPA: MFS transporter, partial [Oligoflexia bacterium]|nr:MFS transporter [Oligoflexia bacterium]